MTSKGLFVHLWVIIASRACLSYFAKLPTATCASCSLCSPTPMSWYQPVKSKSCRRPLGYQGVFFLFLFYFVGRRTQKYLTTGSLISPLWINHKSVMIFLLSCSVFGYPNIKPLFGQPYSHALNTCWEGRDHGDNGSPLLSNAFSLPLVIKKVPGEAVSMDD